MTVVGGYDPGSIIGGLAIQQDGVPLNIATFKSKKKSIIDRIGDFDIFCGMWFKTWRPDIVTIEVIRVSTSHDTTRALSRFEGIFISWAVGQGCEVIEYQVGQSRAAFFGEGLGSMSKEQAHAAMRTRYPELPWLAYDDGGMDQSDALLPALSWEQIKERKVTLAAEKKAKNARKRARK